MCIAGAKCYVTGFASTHGHEKQPTATDFKVAQFRGKTTVEVTYFLFEIGAPLAHCPQPDLSPKSSVYLPLLILANV